MTLAGESYLRDQAAAQSDLSATTGAALVGVADAGSRFTGTTVEAAMQEALVLGDLYVISATAGAEAAQTANTIEVVCAITDAKGTAIASAREVIFRSLAVTADQGDLAAAATPVGTLVKAFTPSTGENVAWFTSTAGGLVTVAVANTAAETTILEIQAEGCRPKLLKLTFA